MVIECTECHTRFKLADDKVKPDGTKVRCSKCKHIFTVMPPAPAPPLDEEIDFGEFNMERLAEPGNAPAAAPPAAEPAANGWEPNRAESATDEFSFGQTAKEEFAFGGDEEAKQAGEFTFGTEPESPPADAAAGRAALDEFSFGDEEGPAESDRFAFGAETETSAPNRFTFEEETETQPTAAYDPEPSAEFTFGDDEEAGPDAFTFETAADKQTADGTFGFEGSEDFAFDEERDQDADEGNVGPDEFSFDANETTGSIEFDFDEENNGEKIGTEFSWDTEEESADEGGFEFGENAKQPAEVDEFDFSGITFGEEENTPAGTVPVEAPLAPSQAQPELLSIDDLRPQREPAPSEAAATPLSEPQPLTLPNAPRRKNPVQRVMFFIGLLLLAMIGGAVYFYWQGGIPELTSLIDRLTGQTAPAQVEGQIRLEGLSSFYVAHPEAGQMLVIQGRAVNDFPAARSSLAVKGVLFNKEGKAQLQQTVFCGNPLDQEALKRLSYAKIEESMNNPFGESLSNLNVAPGKALPFTIVFRNLPADIAEFTVEAVDSKPGSKQ
jgi:predicted Zn finger-like uncharacterized protein